MTTIPALELDGASRTYDHGPEPVTALAPTTLQVPAGHLVVVAGPSGSGKSTLLALLGGLDRPTGGRVAVEGQDLADLDAAGLARLRRQVIGYVFQELNLLPGLTALENVALPLELDGVGARTAAGLARDALDRVGLGGHLDRFPAELSGGEQQRVAVARAMVGDRRIVLADEPTGSLDRATGDRVVAILRGFCDRGGTCVMVTHDPRHRAVADLVVDLTDGRVTRVTPRGRDPEVAR